MSTLYRAARDGGRTPFANQVNMQLRNRAVGAVSRSAHRRNVAREHSRATRANRGRRARTPVNDSASSTDRDDDVVQSGSDSDGDIHGSTGVANEKHGGMPVQPRVAVLTATARLRSGSTDSLGSQMSDASLTHVDVVAAGVVHDDGSQFSDEEADPTLTEDEASRRRIARLGPDTFRSNLEREEQPRSLVFLVVMATALACYAFWRDGM